MFYCVTLLVSLILIPLTMCGIPTPLMLGTIKFPSNIAVSMSVPIFYDGRKIESEVSEGQHKLMFEVPWMHGQQIIYVLITPKNPQKIYKPLLDQNASYNTIDYLKVPSDQEYKLYKLTLVPHFTVATPTSPQLLTFDWNIEREELPSTGKIPDQTVTILYFPDMVDTLEGGSHITLPTIIMRSDMLTFCQSEKTLYTDMVKLQLSALDVNAIHEPVRKSVQTNSDKTIVIGCIA